MGPRCGERYGRRRSQRGQGGYDGRWGAHDGRPRSVRARKRCGASMVSHVADGSSGLARRRSRGPSSSPAVTEEENVSVWVAVGEI